jgi:hypothetical protein
MPTIIANGKPLEICDPCAALMLNHGEEAEVSLCDDCAEKMIQAKIPMKQPTGACAWCGKTKLLTQEYQDHPTIKLCEDCCPNGKLKARTELCTGCFNMKLCTPGYMLAGKVFGLCKPCTRRYHPRA